MNTMLDSLTARLKALPSQHITYYEGAALKVRAFPDLAADVERIVRHLKHGGVGRGQRIGLLANNCYEWLVYDLALLELGVIAVPLPVDTFGQTPRAEVAEQYRLALLLIEPSAQQAGEHWVMRMRLGDPDPVRLRDEISAQPDPDKDLFSLVFSSGTSGRLKCLKISRRGTEALIASFGRDFAFRADDMILAFLPLSSFQQRWMLYTAIHYGFNLGLTVPVKLFHALKDMRPTVLGAAPLLYETVEGKYLTLPDRQRRFLDVLRTLLLALPKSWQLAAGRVMFKPFHDPFGGRIRLAIAGAAPIRHTTLKFFESIGLTLYSAYGLTEAGFLSWNVPGRVKLGSVGKEVYPGTLELADDGEIIFNYPDLLSYGYLGVDPEEERKTFLGKGRIATGDIGRVDADGYFYIEGRKKDIIITQGGVKLQPEDIERAIEREPEVGRAVLFGGGDLPCVMALVSLRSGDSERLRRRIQDHIDQVNRTLPPPARVGKVVFTGQQFTMESGFLNRNLKVDRNKVFGRFQADFMNMSTGDAA